METYHKIQTLFKRDMDGTRTGQKGKMIRGDWTTDELRYLASNEWEFTEKVDGTNIRIGMWAGYETPEFAGRSDNAIIPAPLLDYLQDTFTFELFEKNDLATNPIVLFGEGYGPKIQGGGKYVEDIINANRGKDLIDKEREHKFVLFDVKIGNWWLNRDSVDDIASKLGIESVPTIGHGTLHQAIDIVSGVAKERYHKDPRNESFGPGDYIREVPVGPLISQWGNFEAEGIVARPAVPMFDRKGQRIITKIKAVDFR